MSTVPAEPHGESDADLIRAVRNGTIAAYGTLYERHVAAAYNLARQLARSSAESDDLVAEAFAKVLDTLRAGKGPDTAFRAYLLTALRHTAYDKTRKDKRVDLNEDMSEVTGALGGALTVPFSDTAVAGLERTMAAKAFARLPERWQMVLWHTEIEQQSPAEVAPLLGLTANGVSALAYRAREGLRQAYLQVHLAETSEERCRATADRLGAWVRDGLSKRERAQVEAHLDECEKCRALAAELADVNGALRAVVAPLVLGGAVLGYLATAGAGKAAAATAAVGAAAAGASSGGAAGAAAGAPRQFLGVAASGAAVATAIAVGLSAGGGQNIPAAAPPDKPPATAAPKPPPAKPPAPNPPPPAPPAAPAVVPPPPAVQPAPEPVTPPPPAPIPADLVASTPPDGIELVPGGQPVELPITVRNRGKEKSDPVVATLNLPKGVRALGPAGGGSSTGSATTFRSGTPLRAAPPGGSNSDTVRCPGGTGRVTCRTKDGLEPGESVVLIFRLVADENAEQGQITGTVSGGNSPAMSLRVPVVVAPSLDDVALSVHTLGDVIGVDPADGRFLSIKARNVGPTSKPVTITISVPATLVAGHGAGADCSVTEDTTTCTSDEALDPNEALHIWTVIIRNPDEGSATVRATLGTDSESKTVEIGCLIGPCPGHPEPPNGPTVSGTVSVTPSEPSPTTTTKPPSGSATVTVPPPSGSATVTGPPGGAGASISITKRDDPAGRNEHSSVMRRLLGKLDVLW